jgi:hypothetical protein
MADIMIAPVTSTSAGDVMPPLGRLRCRGNRHEYGEAQEIRASQFAIMMGTGTSNCRVC